MAVVNLHTFPPGSRKAFRIGGKQGRRALLINNRGNLHCIDAQCFHFGGPLWEAPIEELGDRSCLKCPWHEYRIDIATGHCFDNFGTSQGLQQRTHHVHVDQMTGDVYVKENLPVFGQRPMGSDKYCDKKSGVGTDSVTMPAQSGRRAGAASAARRARLARLQAAQKGQQSILNFTQQRKPATSVRIQYNDATPQKPPNQNPNLAQNAFQSPTKPDPLSSSQQLTQPSTPLSSSSQQNLFSQQQSHSSSQQQSARRNSEDIELTQKDNLTTMFGASASPTTPQHSQMRQQSLTDAFRSTRRQTQKIENSQKLFSPHAHSHNAAPFASPSPVKGLDTQRVGIGSDEYTLTQPDDVTQKQLRFDDEQSGNDEDMMDDDHAMGGMTDDEDEYQLTQPRGSSQQNNAPKTLRQSSIASFFSQR